MFRARTRAPAAACGAVLSVVLAPAEDGPITGFTAGNARWQRRHERLLAAVPSARTARDLDAEPAREPAPATGGCGSR